ncbi:hypothetical protein CC78DRAFT_208597 [Lojkania enalia]|uniref:Uncharacterized protein n=1 Tax=Lojkania enalia TaxID=147567 RepID=A0A9P4N452_9PLEO|nr:hypothetical protein CC78DRAFT_208597 [Didymosphaeria enalia]
MPSTIATEERLYLVRHEYTDTPKAQAIPGRNINAEKLTAMLRTKFGIGRYDVYIIHNSYRIIAPRELSTVSTYLPPSPLRQALIGTRARYHSVNPRDPELFLTSYFSIV